MEKKTKAQYALAWILPALIFTVLMFLKIQPLLELDAAYRFSDDESYIGLAAADSYKQAQVYGLSIYEAMPATRESLWHGVQIGVSWITAKAPQAILALNYLFAVLSIFLTSMLARRWCPGPFSTFAATLLYALLPLVLLSGMQGRPAALMLFFGAAACISHLKGIDGDSAPLTFRTALLVGLASMVHVESLLLWLLFGLHAFVVLPFTKRKGVMGVAVFQFIMGLFVLAICLWPLVHWNVMTMQVPWPTSMDAALTLDAAGTETAALGAELMDQTVSIGGSALLLKGLGGLIPLVLLGGLGLITASIKTARLRLLLPTLVFPILLTVGVSAMALVTGQGGIGQVVLLLVPLIVALAVAGIASLPLLLNQDLRLPGSLSLAGLARVLGLAGLLVTALLLTAATTRQSGELVAEVLERQVERQEWQEQLSTYSGVERIATDRPGWAAYQFDPQVIDLNGRCTWKLLSCLDARGGIDSHMYERFLADARPELFVVWGPQGKKMARIMDDETNSDAQLEPDTGGASQWFRLRWPES